MVKNNLWNYLFHKKEVINLLLRVKKLRELSDEYPKFKQKIGDVIYNKNNVFEPVIITGAETLLDLLNIHKEMWKFGFQNEILENRVWFTSNIPEMTDNDVFLGGICDLGINPISEWERMLLSGDLETYRPLTQYQLLLHQYKHILLDGIELVINDVKKEQTELKKFGYVC